MTENEAYSPGAEHPVENKDAPLPLPRQGETEAAWMEKGGRIYVHDAEQASVFETPKNADGSVVRSPMYGMDPADFGY